MVDHLRIYAAYLWELCTAGVLPYSFAESAAQLVKRLEELAPAGRSIGLAQALAAARVLQEKAAAFDAFADGWRERFAKASGGNIDEKPADMLNLAMKRLNRLLIPLASTVRGTYEHDPYGLSAQTTVLPALYDVSRLAALEGPDRWMLETKLRREVNRTADVLSDASVVMIEAMDALGDAEARAGSH